MGGDLRSCLGRRCRKGAELVEAEKQLGEHGGGGDGLQEAEHVLPGVEAHEGGEICYGARERREAGGDR